MQHGRYGLRRSLRRGVSFLLYLPGHEHAVPRAALRGWTGHAASVLSGNGSLPRGADPELHPVRLRAERLHGKLHGEQRLCLRRLLLERPLRTPGLEWSELQPRRSVLQRFVRGPLLLQRRLRWRVPSLRRRGISWKLRRSRRAAAWRTSPVHHRRHQLRGGLRWNHHCGLRLPFRNHPVPGCELHHRDGHVGCELPGIGDLPKPADCPVPPIHLRTERV